VTAYEDFGNPLKLTIALYHEPSHGNVFSHFVEPLRCVCYRVFVCWHRKMSVPFTREDETYRVCLRCGMRRHFDLAEWKMKGSYYNDAGWTHARVTTKRMQLTSQPRR
jgi:hypothetical protein